MYDKLFPSSMILVLLYYRLKMKEETRYLEEKDGIRQKSTERSVFSINQ